MEPLDDEATDAQSSSLTAFHSLIRSFAFTPESRRSPRKPSASAPTDDTPTEVTSMPPSSIKSKRTVASSTTPSRTTVEDSRSPKRRKTSSTSFSPSKAALPEAPGEILPPLSDHLGPDLDRKLSFSLRPLLTSASDNMWYQVSLP
jgi:hypothetical protein